MTIRFDYPNVTSPTTSVVLAAPVYETAVGSGVGLRRLQTRFNTDAGTPIVIDFGDSFKAFSRDLQLLTSAQRDSLWSFFDTTVKGGAETFDYTGQDQVWATVRFQQDVLEMVRESGVYFRCSINLRQD